MKKLFKKKLSKVFHRQGYLVTQSEEQEKIVFNPSMDKLSTADILSDGVDLGGLWETPFQEVTLRPDGPNAYDGMWGEKLLRFQIHGVHITRAWLGSMELLFGGDVSSDGTTIEWGNGQIWVRL